jgi:hypothetical protein
VREVEFDHGGWAGTVGGLVGFRGAAVNPLVGGDKFCRRPLAG